MNAHDLLRGGLLVHPHEHRLVEDLCAATSWGDLNKSIPSRVMAGILGVELPVESAYSDEFEDLMRRVSIYAREAKLSNKEGATQLHALQLDLYLRAALRGAQISKGIRDCVNEACELIDQECRELGTEWLRPVAFSAHRQMILEPHIEIDTEKQEPSHLGQNWRVLAELFSRINNARFAGICYEQAAKYVSEPKQVIDLISRAYVKQQLRTREDLDGLIEGILEKRMDRAISALEKLDGDHLLVEAAVISEIIEQEHPNLDPVFSSKVRDLLDDTARVFYRHVGGDEAFLTMKDPITFVKLTTFTAFRCQPLGLDSNQLFLFAALRLIDYSGHIFQRPESVSEPSVSAVECLDSAQKFLSMVSGSWQAVSQTWLERITGSRQGILEIETATASIPNFPDEIDWNL